MSCLGPADCQAAQSQQSPGCAYPGLHLGGCVTAESCCHCEGTDGHTASKLTLGGLFYRGVIFKYLVILIIYSILKIILKERQERKQQRLQENAVSPAFTSDDVQDVESSGDDLALEQGEPLGAEFCWLLLKQSLSEGSCVQQTVQRSASP